MNIQFREFPSSYQWSQRGIGFALVSLTVGGLIFRVCPEEIRFFAMACIGLLVLSCLLLSHYVIIRYPYISLVESEDGDPFSKHFASTESSLYMLLKFIGMLFPLVIAAAIWATGFQNTFSQLIFAYCISLFLFMVFFAFAYNSVRHPTVATFIRCTLGLGIPLYPLYAVTIVIGAWRCRYLLDSQT